MVNSIVQLFLGGVGSFGANYKWINEVTGTLFCPHCHNVYDAVQKLDAVVGNNPRHTDIDLIAVNCGRVQLFSTDFIGVIGPELVEKSASLGRLYAENGFEHERYRTVVARKDFLVIRGPKKSSIKLCRECERLLYWPIGKQYILRSDLPKEPFFVSDGKTFCTPDFYEERIRGAKLSQVAARKLPIRDDPLDGYPADLGAMKKILNVKRIVA